MHPYSDTKPGHPFYYTDAIFCAYYSAVTWSWIPIVPPTPLFVQQLDPSATNGKSKSPHYCSRWLPSQKASNAANVSMLRHLHVQAAKPHPKQCGLYTHIIKHSLPSIHILKKGNYITNILYFWMRFSLLHARQNIIQVRRFIRIHRHTCIIPTYCTHIWLFFIDNQWWIENRGAFQRPCTIHTSLKRSHVGQHG